MESYNRILNCLLLREVIGHLPVPDQLTVRKVNKDWEDEARFALRQNPKLKIRLDTHDDMNDYLLTFYTPPSGPMRLLQSVNTVIGPACIQTDRIQLFAQYHAEHVRTLTILDCNANYSQEAYNAKLIMILNRCTNLQQLKFKNGPWVGLHRRASRMAPDIPAVGQLAQLLQLRHIEFKCVVSDVQVLLQIIENAPVLSSYALRLVEYLPFCDLLTPTFFNELKLLRMSPKMSLMLSLAIESGQNSLLDELIRAEVKPKKLIVKVEPSFIHHPDVTPTEFGKNLLRNLLTQICRNGLEKLEFRTRFRFRNGTQIHLPDEMPWIKSLTFDMEYGSMWIIPSKKLTSAQVPNLEIFVTPSKGMLLNEGDCYPKMKTLVFKPGSVLSAREEPLPSSVTWPNQFPNLTTLSIYLNVGEETLLYPILTRMLNLVDLTLEYKNQGGVIPPDPIWDMITGIVRPILGKDSPVNSVIPPEAETPTQETDAHAQDLPTVAAIHNLRKLQFLKLENVNSNIVAAIVHLTAIHKLPRLSKLKMLRCSEGPFAQEWIDALSREHDDVEISYFAGRR